MSEKSKKIYLSITILLVILASITISFNSKENNSSEKTKKTKEIKKNDISQKQIINSKEEIEKQKMEILNTINEAGVSGDISLCNFIENESSKQDCIDNGNLAKAGIENNRKYCLIVKNNDLKKRCNDNYYYISSQEKNDKKICDKINDKNLKNKCNEEVTLKIIEDSSFSGSIEICNDLSLENKSYCINKINNSKDIEIFNAAISLKDSKKCNEIKNKELLENCSDGLNIEFAIKNSDLNTCNLIFDLEKKEYCKNNIQVVDEQKLMKDAIDKKNIELCIKIKTQALNTKCSDIINLKIAIESIDNKKCEIIKDSSYRKECLDFFNSINNQK